MSCHLFTAADVTEGKAPEIVTYMKDVHGQDGSQVEMECQVAGHPRPTVTWYKDEQMIYQSEEFQIIYDDENVSKLIIADVYPEDAGKYTAVAKNEFGTAMTSAELFVAGKF